MSFKTYFSSGFCHMSNPKDLRSGTTELVLYNPNSKLSKATVTAYFESQEPFTLTPVVVQPGTNLALNFPEMEPRIFRDCGFWGGMVMSNQPLLLNILSGMRIQPGVPTFTGGWTSFPGTNIDRIWRFPDGLWLDWCQFYNGDLSKAPFPFNENEHYLILNPHPKDIDIEMIQMYHRKDHVHEVFRVPAKCMFMWDNQGKVPYNENYTIKIVAEESVAASAVRYIYDLKGIEEWGLQVHLGMLGVPGETTVPKN